MPDARFAFAALALAITRDKVTDSAEVPGTVAGREIGTVTSGHSQAEEGGDQEHILHFAGLTGLAKVFSKVEEKEEYIYRTVIVEIILVQDSNLEE